MKLNATEVKGLFDHCFKALLELELNRKTYPNHNDISNAAHKLTKAYVNKLKELGGDGDLGPLDPRDGDNPYDINAVGCSVWDPRCRKVGGNPFNWGPYVVRVRKGMLGKDGFSCGPW